MVRKVIMLLIFLLLSTNVILTDNLLSIKKTRIVNPSKKLLTDTRHHNKTSKSHLKEIPLKIEEDTLYYGTLEYYNALGLDNGGTFKGTIRLTINEYFPYFGWKIIAVCWYHYDGSSPDGLVEVCQPWPGDSTWEYFYGADSGWVRVNLSNPLEIIDSLDIWCSVQVTHGPGKKPLGLDPGPVVDGKGDWIYYNGSWSELQDFGYDNNWLIMCIVDSSDVGIDYTKTPKRKSTYSIKFSPIPMSTKGTMTYSVPVSTDVEINIYDITGRFVRNLVKEKAGKGTHIAIWDGKNEKGKTVPQGIYFYNFVAPGNKNTGKITVTK